jgi:arylsulfatase
MVPGEGVGKRRRQESPDWFDTDRSTGMNDAVPRYPRDILPIPREPAPSASAVDIRDQSPPYVERPAVLPPEGAPNVVVILLDDMGFGASSAFGGPCQMPAADRLAAAGLRYTRFHTTAICSSTRAALLTGRNHHSVGMGTVTNIATPAPGYNAMMPPTAATIARTLTANGYATGAFGKMHETPQNELTPVGPFDRWPTVGEGFERFYGFLGGAVHQWYPALFDGTTPVDPPSTPEEGYHLSQDIVDQAIGWIRNVRTLHHRPFFCYVPFGATHSPFHVHRDWVDKYRGQFDEGWDRQREVTLARQKELGIVPDDTQLAPWAHNLPHWDELDARERRAAALQMEVYAGFAEHTDAQVGRLVDALEELECLENTIIFYILGDNGASGEGGELGTINEYLDWNGADVSTADILAQADELGGPSTWPHYPAGWALAMDTPYQWVKQVASHYGGTRNGLIVHWPAGIEEPGGLRHQWHHVIDVVPTILEAAHLPAPTVVDGAVQQPIEGTAMNYSLNAPSAPDRHITQYFEIGGSRGIYHDGWVACTVHRPAPWNFHNPEMPSFRDDIWELYDTDSDWSQAWNIADEHPQRLGQLKELFLIEAARYQVLPLDDRPMAVRCHAADRGRIETMTFQPNAHRFHGDAIPNIIGKSYSITAEIVVPDGAVEGVICAQGGRFSGWSLYCKDGTLTYCQNLGSKKETYYVRATEPLPHGKHEIKFTFDYEGEGLGQAGTGMLLVDGLPVGKGHIPRTVAFLFQVSEEFNVGVDPLTPVTDEYKQFDNAFAGVIGWVRIDLGQGVGITPEDRLQIEIATH